MLLDMKYFYEVNAFLGERNCAMLDFYLIFFFNRLGYDGVYSKRTFDKNDEGCATFYNTSKFTLKDNVAYRLGEIAFKVHTYIY